ncbi:hypothetical protein JMJ77_0007458, partial [Colletotrichum scovillei]
MHYPYRRHCLFANTSKRREWKSRRLLDHNKLDYRLLLPVHSLYQSPR